MDSLACSVATPCARALTDGDKKSFFQAKVMALWGLSGRPATVPCPLPVTLDEEALQRLETRPYLVGPKLDGVRYVLLLTQLGAEHGGANVAVMINRRWDMYLVRVAAPSMLFSRGSLFDGELVTVPVSAPNSPTRQVYYVFDVMAMGGKCLTAEFYPQRFAAIRTLFFCGAEDEQQLRNPMQWLTHTAAEVAQREWRIVCQGNEHCLAFHVRPWLNMASVEVALRAYTGLPSDGLVFMPVAEPMGARRHPTLYKYKETHTIDLVIGPDRRLYYYNGTKNVADPLDVPGVPEPLLLLCPGLPEGIETPPSASAPPGSSAATAPVGEFAFGMRLTNMLLLSFVGLRADKQYPNDYRTVAAAMQCSLFPIPLERLLEVCKRNTVILLK